MGERWNEERMESPHDGPDATLFFGIDVSTWVSHSASWEQLPDGASDAPHSGSESAPIRAGSRRRPPYGSPIQGPFRTSVRLLFFFVDRFTHQTNIYSHMPCQLETKPRRRMRVRSSTPFPLSSFFPSPTPHASPFSHSPSSPSPNPPSFPRSSPLQPVSHHPDHWSPRIPMPRTAWQSCTYW